VGFSFNSLNPGVPEGRWLVLILLTLSSCQRIILVILSSRHPRDPVDPVDPVTLSSCQRIILVILSSSLIMWILSSRHPSLIPSSCLPVSHTPPPGRMLGSG